MPIIYEYLGIKISFFSNEHQPIHIHATYGSNIVKVLIYTDGDTITTIKYLNDRGAFSPAQLKDLKEFVSRYKYAILYAWKQFFIEKNELSRVRITKRIK